MTIPPQPEAPVAQKCGYCDGKIESSNPRARFCRRRCKELARQRRQQQAKLPAGPRRGECIDCGDVFTFGARGARRVRCEECHQGYRVCALCGQSCRPAPGGLHCQRCKTELAELIEAGGEVEDVHGCHECGDPFVRTRATAKWCSRRCCDAADRRRNPGRFRARSSVRRSRVRGAYVGESIDPAEIYARDDYTCQLCNLPLLMDAYYQTKWAPTLDHIVPIVRGGLHTRQNLQAAHRYCNSIKRDTYEIEDALPDVEAALPDLVLPAQDRPAPTAVPGEGTTARLQEYR